MSEIRWKKRKYSKILSKWIGIDSCKKRKEKRGKAGTKRIRFNVKIRVSTMCFIKCIYEDD
jgi:hypothetical protein